MSKFKIAGSYTPQDPQPSKKAKLPVVKIPAGVADRLKIPVGRRY